MAESTKEITKKQSLVGVVISDKMDKTRVVSVTSYEKHPKYGKFIKRSKRYKAHDAENQYKVGDRVRLEACRPVSRHKQFAIVEKIGVAEVKTRTY
ncbi:MAG TPA: 30S ribosomal protein S17 [Candidatus Paceibacterota bacterium]|nr:30S ribosomal protein S17 [Candidatus Paceibacterota bacterium]